MHRSSALGSEYDLPDLTAQFKTLVTVFKDSKPWNLNSGGKKTLSSLIVILAEYFENHPEASFCCHDSCAPFSACTKEHATHCLYCFGVCLQPPYTVHLYVPSFSFHLFSPESFSYYEILV